MSPVVQRAALALAIATLALLGWRAWQPRAAPPEAITHLTLWTAGTDPALTQAGGEQRALPDAIEAPSVVARVPDAAFLRRTFPALQEIEILGDGVSASDAAALTGLAVRWGKSTPSSARAEFTMLSAPRRLQLGGRLAVQGRVRGIGAASTTLTLEAPDGSTQSTELRGDQAGEAGFAFFAPPTSATGPAEWALRLGANGPRAILGADVQPRRLPRILFLQASPSVETARLQRWLADAGGAVAGRVRVSAEHFRTTTANGAPVELEQINAATLRAFDLVVTEEAALAALRSDEQAALAEAVRARGIGLLILGDPAIAGATLPELIAPWRISLPTTTPEETRTTRLRLADGTNLMEARMLLPAELPQVPLARWLVRDMQDRSACALAPAGRGRVARSLVLDTWRWLQSGQPDQFATFWSEVLSAVAPPASDTGWIMENGSAPVFVAEPVALLFSTSADPPASASVRPRGATDATNLALARDPREPMFSRALYWPSASGWHEVQTADGAALSFYVHPRTALAGVERERRHGATQRLVLASRERSAETSGTSPQASTRAPTSWLIDAVAFIFFVASAGLLFLDARRK